MRTQRTRRLRAMVLTSVLLAALVLAPTAVAHDRGTADHRGEVSPSEDDPDGCETATSESDDGCGGQGRDHFGSAAHQPPVDACADRPTEGGGRITRILPDGPRREDGSLAFISGACVYLPPGYGSSGLRYPVLYLLHGGGGDQSNWVTMGGVGTILDAAYAAKPEHAMVVVMPDGRSGQWYDYEDGSFRIATYVLEHLIPYVDQHFRTLSARDGRVVAGLSNGGYGALHMAAKRPDLFVAAGAMSSNLGARGMSGLGPPGAVHYQGSVPYQLAPNLDGVDLALDLGTSCSDDVTVDLCATLLVDLAFLPDHRAFEERMREVGHVGAFDYQETEGSHAWRWWSKWLREHHLPFFFERLAAPSAGPPEPPPVPEEFRYRTIAETFEVWDHHVRVHREAREFLELTEVRRSGLVVRGSGFVEILTASRHRPNAPYLVEGATDESQVVRADHEGRLLLRIDLGPSHLHDQFTPEAQVAEAADDGYWVTRTVAIRAIDHSTT